jgi:hypothetical protein
VACGAAMHLTFVQTCPACPEQYDAVDETGQQVGYLRLRHGRFRVDYPHNGGTTIYEADLVRASFTHSGHIAVIWRR